MKWAILCDGTGRDTLGSDGKIPIDGRLNQASALDVCRRYRNRYRKHFPHKVARWTHVVFAQSLRGQEGTPIRLE
jgi:hypothetical protein